MPIQVSGVQIGTLSGGPVSINLSDLADTSIVSPQDGQYLRYNGTIDEWQNTSIDADMFLYLDTSLSGINGVEVIYTPVTNQITVGLTPTGAQGTYPKVTVDTQGRVIAGDILAFADVTDGLGYTPYNVTNPAGYITGAGNAATATSLETGRLLSASGDATGSSTAFNGTANAVIPLTLASVNSAPQTDSFRKITVNNKGLTTATTSVDTLDITTALGYTPINKAGDTMTGLLILSGDPVTALGAATKQYVDNVVTGIDVKPAVLAATTANLDATYDNGALGVGATLTATANGEWTGVDGAVAGWTVGSGVLVKNQTNPADNGLYNVTDLGTVGTPWVLTRYTDADTSNEIPGSYVFIEDGAQAGTGWLAVVDDAGTFVVGTDDIIWSQFSGSGTYTAGSGIAVASNVISNTGVLSVAGTAGNITSSTTTGAVTLNLAAVTNTGAGTFQKLSRDSFGRVTGTTAVLSGDITSLVDDTYVNVDGDTMVGPLVVNSTVTVSGVVSAASFNATSTIRVKEAVTDIGQSYIDRFANLRPCEYDRKDYVAHEFGFIAEEVALVYPEVVGIDADGRPSGVDYGKLSTILTAKVQDQQKTIDKLQEQMAAVLELLKGSN
jgi:hypothetical protein